MKKIKVGKLVACIFSFLLLSITFTGCSSDKASNTKVTDDLKKLNIDIFENDNSEDMDNPNYVKFTDKITIGFAMDSLKDERWKKDKEIFLNKANEIDVNVRVTEADGDEKLQISQAEQLIAEGVNILVVVPVNGDAASEIVEKAHLAGIKVLSYDRLIKGSDLDYYISFDNVKVGEIQAKAILEVVQKGNFAYVGGSPADNNALLFRDGAMNVLKGKIESGDISLVMDKYSDNWDPNEAYKNVKEMLNTNNNKINGIICANDGTASGAIQALKEVGLEGKIPVTGQDADLNAIQRIVEGKQFMTVYKPVKEIAEKAVELAVDIANNKDINTNSTVDNGYKKVPSYLLEPVEVTKDNVEDTIIKDGWQKAEDVYKNVE